MTRAGYLETTVVAQLVFRSVGKMEPKLAVLSVEHLVGCLVVLTVVQLVGKMESKLVDSMVDHWVDQLVVWMVEQLVEHSDKGKVGKSVDWKDFEKAVRLVLRSVERKVE
jgi:hypothetical protein